MGILPAPLALGLLFLALMPLSVSRSGEAKAQPITPTEDTLNSLTDPALQGGPVA